MPEAQARAAISDEEVSALLEKNGADAVRPYDFAAQRINRMQLPLLEVVSKSFAERAGASLSALLGRDAAMQFTSLESAKSADLQAALPVPQGDRSTSASAKMVTLRKSAFSSFGGPVKIGSRRDAGPADGNWLAPRPAEIDDIEGVAALIKSFLNAAADTAVAT